MNYKSILDLNNVEAKEYFMDAKRYCTLDLPDYFDFNPLLKDVDSKILSSGLDLDKINPNNCENVNYKILLNKDGQYQWREVSLIHPVLYIDLVNLITKKENWQFVINRFNELKVREICCCSYPIVMKNKEKKHVILNWYQNFERKAIEKCIDFKWMVKTDITNCYGSIYTHSISWALVGKDIAKANKHKKELFYNKIDSKIQGLQYGQTNGIPQGSVLMDFIAEIVLAYADNILENKCKESGINDFYILRYRDDYRIFTQTKNDAEGILKLLSVTLSELNLRLNDDKTKITSDIILNSIKKEKLDTLISPINQKCNYVDKLIVVLNNEKEYPNNSQAIKVLQKFFNKIKNKKRLSNTLGLISVNAELMINYPKNYAICSAIFSKLLSLINDSDAYLYIDKILKKSLDKPYTEYLEIWIQRITIVKNRSYSIFNSSLCKKIFNPDTKLWNSLWLKNYPNIIDENLIINEEKIKKLKSIISIDEISEFDEY